MFGSLSVNGYVIVCGVVSVICLVAAVWTWLVGVVGDDVARADDCIEQCGNIGGVCCRAAASQEPCNPSREYLESIAKPSKN